MNHDAADATASVPAPGLAEVAAIWWDRDEVPVIGWSSDSGVFRFVLVGSAGETISLLQLGVRMLGDVAPSHVAAVLADGLAACDFPPTEHVASAGRVAATLRVAGLGHLSA